jgi:hypothetical protein
VRRAYRGEAIEDLGQRDRKGKGGMGESSEHHRLGVLSS